MGGLAASAGYMVAMPANRIFASESTITGSIGVLMETGEVSGLLGKLGITADALTSGPLKDQPSYTQAADAGGPRGAAGAGDGHVRPVRRHGGRPAGTWTPDAVRALADGRAYTGRQALKLGLIDAIGGEQDARAWLETAKGVAEQLPVEESRPSTLTEPHAGERVLARSWSPCGKP